MHKISAEWTTAMSPDGKSLPDDATWAPNESQITLTVHVPTFSTGIGRPMADVKSAGQSNDAIVGLPPFGAGETNIWNIHKFIGQCLGYTRHESPRILKRWTPARHPLFPHLRATKITRMHGIGERKRVLSPLSLILNLPYRVEIVVPQTWELTILFQSLLYEVKEDLEIGNDPAREGERYVETYTQPTVEILNKPGGTFKFVEGSGAASGKDFPQPLGMLYGTCDLIQKWINVPKSAIYDSAGIPSQILGMIGKVNDTTIKGTFNLNIDVGDDFVGAGASASGTVNYAPGNLLLTAAVITPEQSPVPPQMMGLDPLQATRTFSVEYRLKFNPNGHNRLPYIDGGFFLATNNGLFPPGGKTIYEATDLSQMFIPLTK